MDNFQPKTLRRVISFNSVRAHDCPNCQCTASHTSNHQIYARPLSPGVNFRNMQSFQISQSPMCRVSKPLIYQNNYERQNFIKPHHIENSIYLKKTDLVQEYSNIMKSSASRGSIQKRNYRVLSPSQINIRYVSPARDSRQQNSLKKQKQDQRISNKKLESNKPSIYFNRGAFKQQQLLVNLTASNASIEQPRVPSILLKKSSQTKKQKQKQKMEQYPSPASTKHSETESNQQTYKQIERGKTNEIISRSAIKSYPQPNNQIREQWKKRSSAFDLLVGEQNDDKRIANEIMNDLKLNYDYYQTRDISKIMSV